MSTTLRFYQHDEFHRAALHMAVAGGLAGLGAHAAFHDVSSPWSLTVVAAAAAVGAMGTASRQRIHELVVRASLVALAAAVLLVLGGAGQDSLALIAFGGLTGLAFGWGLRGWRLGTSVVGGALVVLLARYTFLAIGMAAELAALPDWLVTTMAGIAFSLVSVMAVVPRHVDVVRDPVVGAYAALAGTALGAEARELVDRAYKLWTTAAGELSADAPNREALQQGAIRLIEVARRWQAVEGAAATQSMAASLVERMEALDTRIEATEDAVSREQYQQARAALAEQLRYIKDIGTSRERVLARMHNYLAAMERLRMAAINQRSSDASRDASEIGPLVDNLEQLGADMDASSEALGEMERLA